MINNDAQEVSKLRNQVLRTVKQIFPVTPKGSTVDYTDTATFTCLFVCFIRNSIEHISVIFGFCRVA